MDFTITLAREPDAAEIAAIYAPYVLNTPISFEYEPPSADEIAARIRKVREAELPWLVAKDSRGKVLGYAYATKHKERAAYQWCVESSVYVDSTLHRGGIGRALYTKLFDVLTQLGYQNVFAGAAVPNDQSVKFHESFGFTVAARYQNIGFKHGKWHNTVWWQKTLGPPPDEPSSPKPLSSIKL
jgi:phosphinothricin acetyltransferase